jgi:hypothetical protein
MTASLTEDVAQCSRRISPIATPLSDLKKKGADEKILFRPGSTTQTIVWDQLPIVQSLTFHDPLRHISQFLCNWPRLFQDHLR